MLCLRIGTLLFLAMLLTETTQTVAAPRSEAFVGQPFGVGRVTVDVFRGEPSLPLSDERFTVLEAEGRAIYPVLKEEPARRNFTPTAESRNSAFGHHLLSVSGQ